MVPDGASVRVPLRFRDAVSAQRQTLAGRIRPPAHRISCRLTVSYAGFSGESVPLEELYKRRAALPEVGPSLRAGDRIMRQLDLPNAPSGKAGR
jgi:hypothetical protein